MFHVAEEIVIAPYLRFAEIRDAKIVDEEGVARPIAFRRYNCYQSGVRRDLDVIGAAVAEAGVVQTAQIGASECRLVRARDVIDVSCEMLRTRLDAVVTYDP